MKKVLVVGSVFMLFVIIAFMPTKETHGTEMETAILKGFSTPVENGNTVFYGVFLSDSGNTLYIRDSFPASRRISVIYNKITRENWLGTSTRTNVVEWHLAGVPR